MDLATLRQQIPHLDGLTDDQAVDAIHEAYYPDMSRDAVAQRLGIKPPPAPEKKRTWGEAASDTGRGIMSGLAGLAKTAGDVYGVVSGDFDNPVSELAGNAQQYWHDGQSPALNDARQRRANAIQASDGILGKAATAIAETVTDPKLLADTVAENATTMLAPLAAAKAVQAVRVAQLARAGIVSEQAAAAAAKAATAAAIATGAVQQGADVASNAYDQALKTTAQDLQQNPDYVQRVQAGEDPSAVLRDLASKAGQAAFLPATAVSVASQFIPGSNAAERALIGGLAKVPAKNAIAGAVKGLVGEGTQEAIEEGGGQYAANATNKAYVNPNQDMSQDVGMNAGLGAVGGMALGGVGGIFHGDHGHATASSPLQQPPQVPDNGPLSRAANAALDTMHREAATLALPAPSIQVTPGGTAFTTDQRNSLMQGVMDDKPGGIVDVTPIPQQPGARVRAVQGPQEQIDQSLQNIKNWGQRAEPVPLEKAQSYKAAFDERGVDVTVIPHPAGQGFTVVPSQWIAPFMRDQAQQSPLSGMLPGPDTAAPGAPLVSDNGAVRPQTYGDQAQSRSTASAWKAEAQRKAEIGLTPDVEQAQRTRSLEQIKTGDITTQSGNPFLNVMAVKKAVKKTPGDIIEVRGGWVIRPAAQDAKVNYGNTGGTARLSDKPGAQQAPDAGSGLDGIGNNAAVRRGAELHGDSAATGGKGTSPDSVSAPVDGTTGGVVDRPVTEKRKLKKVSDLYGSTHYVDARELASDATMLKRYRQDGVPISTEGKTRLHRDNIDLDGSKAKNAWKDLPALDNSGKGFGTAEAVARAIKRMKQDFEAFDIKQHDGSGRWYAVRKQPSIKGEAIDKDWSAFAPESGTLGIPRADMPQIKAEHRGAMVNFLNARGVEHEQDEVPARSLKPTQAEFSPEKVQKAKDFTGGDRSILVSEDGHVVDGHHQWLAKHDAGEHVKVIRLKAPIKDLIETVKAFPSAEQQDGSTKSDASNAVPDSRDATGKQASWVILEKSSGKAVMETFDKKVSESINTEKYEAVPIADHLASLNSGTKEADANTSATASDYSKRSVDWLRQNGGETITVKEAIDALVKKQRAIMEDQNSWTPRDSAGHPVSGVNLYTSDAMQKLDKISWAIANLMQHQKTHGDGKAEKPAEPTTKTEPLSKTIEKVNAKHGEGLTEADRVPDQNPASKTPVVDSHFTLMQAVGKGEATAEQFKQAFNSLVENKDAVKAELDSKTKTELLRRGGAWIQMRYANEKKSDVVDAFYRNMLGQFVLGETLSYGMGKGAYESAIRRLVESTDDAKLQQYAKDREQAIKEAEAEKASRAAAMENPQSLDDFRNVINAKIRAGMTRREAFLSLTPEQRVKYDELEAESTRDAREARKRDLKTQVKSAGQTTGGEIIATKHTRDGHNLWVVRLADRLSTEDYKTVLASAKRLGGSYSSYRGNGAVPGFQFRTPEAADAFLKLAGGDTTAAQGVAEQRRDSFEDDRSQSAVERLREMADKLDEGAQEQLDMERKVNTARRARFAAAAERAAQEGKALAKTMRNIAQAIEDKKAKFLDAVRTKSQVEALRSYVYTAKDNELRDKYKSYADVEKRRGEPATDETADFADFPAFTAFRSDLAALARQMLEVDGTKKMGQQLMSVADDITDAYVEFAKKPENLYKLSTFSIRQGDEVKAAIFPSKDAAERALRRSGLAGKAMVLAEKRGVNRIIMSPSEAMNQGIWTGDADKRITLKRDFGAEMVQAIGRRGNKSNGLAVPWQFQTAHDRLNGLKRMGIETPSEFRSALREFIRLQERATASKVREMELAMVGRKNDGLDFFPTPEAVADQMVEAADLQPDMAVLEPSAGMGHIADRIRAAGAEPDVVEMSGDRRELLQEKGYHLADVNDFMDMKPREVFTYGDVFRAPDGTEGILSGSGGMASSRVGLRSESGEWLGWFNRDELTPVRHRGADSGYDRIIMNPPFSGGRDIDHVQHAYELLKPGGRLVAIMGEGAFFNQSKKAEAFRQWLDEKGGTSEKLAEGSFMDSSLPVTTGVNARMVVVDKPEFDGGTGFSRDTDQSEKNALKALSESDDLFRLPKSDKTTVAEIAAENDPGIQVKKLPGIPGRTEYQLTMPDGATARLVVRPANPYGNNTYGFDYEDGETSNVLDQRPGDNPEDVDPSKEDVWIDVSLLKPGQDGAKVYNIAATYAHNTGRIFIGDPSGLSNEALRRRSEQMLSSALKFGTTEHIAPHPRQITGDDRLGVPPLKWVYGDDIGNIRRLIDLNLASLENAGGNPITFNPATGEYLDSEGANLSRGGIKALAESGLGTAAGAGSTTLERSAVLRSLLRQEGRQAGAGDGRSNGLLGRIVELHAQHRAATDGIFYSREGVKASGEANAASADHVALVKSMVDKITAKWKNAPDVIVLASFSEAPEAVQRENDRQVAGGASGEPGAFFYGGKAYLLASRMKSLKQVRKAVFHEVLGHLGLRGLYGSEMGAILDQLYKVRRDAIEKKALQYGLDLNEVRDRRMATEEYLADIAQSEPKLGFVRRAIAAIRSWLRRNVPALAKTPMTDEELISDLILPVQRFIKEGPDGTGGKLSPAFMRSDAGFNESSFSRTTAAHEYADKARIATADFFGRAGSRVDWLDRSLKTQYAKADKFPAFGKVFNKVQDYIEGVSALANEAADKAPSILPKLDTFSDLWKNGILNHGLKPEDRKAVSAPVFDGTLEWSRVDGKLVRTDELAEKASKLTVDKKARQMLRDGKVSQVELNNWMASKLDTYDAAVNNRYDREYLTPGVVFTDQELKDIYKLTPEQIGHYREFRASVDESLDQVAAAEIVRLVPNLPDEIVAMAQSPQGRAGLRDAVEQYLGNQDNDLWNQVQDKYLQTEKLKSRGYAPLSRFGKFFVHAVDENGQTQYFGLAETRSQANRLARELKEEFGTAAQIEQGLISQEQYKLMSAVPMDAMEIFASAIGADESEVFQKYLQLAKNNRSTMKRLIRRKGTAGFSQDVPRVLANFVTSNARAVSTNLHVLDARKLVAEIKEGDIKDEAFNLVKAVTEPEESGAAIRGVMFANFIGGSIASAVVNVTQPVMMTLPYLSQWGGAVKAAKRLASAAAMAMVKNAGDADLQAALKRAEHEGVVSPQEIHHLIQRAAGGLAERHPILQKMAFVWGAPFALAEQFNRRASFIAAYQTAREEGMPDPFAFAEKAVIETQGLYNAGNKPNAARGIAGATAMTFKQYSIHYLEWLARMAKSGKEGKKAAALALALLALVAGADGLPFMGDLDDVFDTIGQAMGYDTNTKRWRHKMASDVLGYELGDVMTRGVSASAGMPFDVSARMGMGNLIPATDLLMKSNNDTARSIAEIAGPGGGMFIQYRDAVKAVLNGDLLEGARKAMPAAVQNAVKGIEMAATGEYRDTRGRKVVDVGPVDAASKILGFQPSDVARDSERLSDVRQSESLARMTEAEITDAWARAIVEGDSVAERQALDMRDQWNEKNPDQKIVVKRSQAIKKARQLQMDRKDRFAKTVAPERRQSVKSELQ